MPKSLFQLTLLLAGAFLCTACPGPDTDNPNYEAIFISRSELDASIAFEEPKTLEESGKLFWYGDLLLVNEPNVGIHLFNIADSTNPVPISFIRMIGNTDLSVYDNTLLANNAVDLVSIDISNPQNLQLLHRARNVFPEPDLYFDNDENRPDSIILVGYRETLTP